MSDAERIRRELDRIVRRERGRLVAGLAARLGPVRIDVAEDVAQEALLQALEGWDYKGMPDQPAAWLARVARNKAIDRLRREGREDGYDDDQDARTAPANDTVHGADVADPELRLIVLCCHPALTMNEQLALTLKLSGGFTAREVAAVFVADEAAVGQRLARARRKLKSAEDILAMPGGLFELRRRMPAVLKAVYLLFSLGYAPRTGDRLVLNEVCGEALRLAELLADHAATRGPEAEALAALLNLQSARLPARVGPNGKPALLKDQDRSLWDRHLIDAGLRRLAAARDVAAPTPYHLEAAISAAHCSAPSWAATDWTAIGKLYGALEALTGSPVVAVNACVAEAMSGDPVAALARLDRLSADPRLKHFVLVQLARGELLAMLNRRGEAAKAYQAVADGKVSAPVRRHLEGLLGDSL